MRPCFAITSLVSLPVLLLAGCDSRAAPAGDGVSSTELAVCQGPAPIVQLNGMNVEIGPVRATLEAGRYSVVFPLVDYPLATELAVRVQRPSPGDFTFEADLCELPGGFVEVEAKPFESMAVMNTMIFKLGASDSPEGWVRLSRHAGVGDVGICLSFHRHTDWFHPDQVILYTPSKNVPPAGP